MNCSFYNKTATVIGIGISNSPLISFLLEKGAIVTARDKKEYADLPESAKELEGKGVRLICGENYLEDINEEYIFRTPGLRYDTEQLQRAVEKGSILTSEMELFFELCPSKTIAVTGSDGKTTTTTLISKMIQARYGHVYVGGNIGMPLLPMVEKMTKDDYAVLELSSFQLHTMKRSPDIAVITNLSPNHLDYHKDMDEYTDAKKNIFRYQKDHSRLILNYRNDITRKMAEEARPGSEVLFFGKENDVWLDDGIIYYKGEEVLSVKDILLPGKHNVENYMAAIAAVYDLVGKDIIVELARTFKGVEHRMEFVRNLGGVRYYNSSIDSSPTRTAAALSSFDQKVIVICGGYDKHIPFEPLALSLCKYAKAVVLTGATAGKIKDTLINSPEYKEGYPIIIEESDFDKAVIAASNAAQSGDIVVLSPACASYDAFPNFEFRGRRFKNIINSL